MRAVYIAAHLPGTNSAINMFVALFTNPVLGKFHQLVDYVYNGIDTAVYYVINAFMMVLLFTDVIVEMVDKMIYNYNIVVSLVRHKMHNNIN